MFDERGDMSDFRAEFESGVTLIDDE